MTRKEIEAEYGRTWTTEELQKEFTVKGFAYCFCIAERKADHQVGSLDFTSSDDAGRLYHSFVEDK